VRRSAPCEDRLAKVEGERDDQNFESELNRGFAERKLSPAEVTLEREQYATAKSEGRAAARVEELKGRLKVASPRLAATVREPAGGVKTHAVVLEYQGKKYDDMTYAQRGRLSKDEPDLFREMKADYDERRKSA
jgi:hypothetical protein